MFSGQQGGVRLQPARDRHLHLPFVVAQKHYQRQPPMSSIGTPNGRQAQIGMRHGPGPRQWLSAAHGAALISQMIHILSPPVPRSASLLVDGYPWNPSIDPDRHPHFICYISSRANTPTIVTRQVRQRCKSYESHNTIISTHSFHINSVNRSLGRYP